MMPSAALFSSLATIGCLIAAMTLVAAIETVLPLHARGRGNHIHLAPNVALTLLTFATNLGLNIGLVSIVVWLESRGFGLLRAMPISPLAAALLAIAALDFSFYAAHVSWHRFPSLWRFHAVHHSDPAVDVTTTIRQHPVESLLRYAAMGAMAIVIGPSPAAFGVYRVTSALSGFLEHANLRAPRGLDRMLALVVTWPHMHKIHHSRIVHQTDTNYGNLFSVWDRLLRTYTPSSQGTAIVYGLDGFDADDLQTTRGLLALPFRQSAPAPPHAPESEMIQTLQG
jgi:sterol desaturase/sphingolipid hydroxylase (fatty acid hydroxylase superfamily)